MPSLEGQYTKTVYVLVVVDVDGALTKGLQQNVYLVDTNKHLGSGNEGQAELVTQVPAGSRIVWSLAPVNPGSDIDIGGFTGQAITSNVIAPVAAPDGSFTTLFQPQNAPSGTQFQYSMNILVNGDTPLSFDPFLVVK